MPAEPKASPAELLAARIELVMPARTWALVTDMCKANGYSVQYLVEQALTARVHEGNGREWRAMMALRR